MKKLLIGALVALSFGVAANAQTHVRGYTRSDGTYVAPHYRSNPNGTTSDNYSTRGNYNPYTGAPGTKPDTRPSSIYGSSSGSSYGSAYGRSTSSTSVSKSRSSGSLYN